MAEAFTEVEPEIRTGDRLQVTRNNYLAHRLSGATAMVVAIDVAGSTSWSRRTMASARCSTFAISPTRTSGRDGSAPSTPASATCDRVMAHLESFRANTVDTRAAYVAISRAREGAAIYTDGRAKLTEAL